MPPLPARATPPSSAEMTKSMNALLKTQRKCNNDAITRLEDKYLKSKGISRPQIPTYHCHQWRRKERGWLSKCNVLTRTSKKIYRWSNARTIWKTNLGVTIFASRGDRSFRIDLGKWRSCAAFYATSWTWARRSRVFTASESRAISSLCPALVEAHVQMPAYHQARQTCLFQLPNAHHS